MLVAVAALAEQAESQQLLGRAQQRHGALAAVNGGYFVIGAADGTPGDLAGSSILGGRLGSEAVDGRTDLVRGARRQAIDALADAQTARASDRALIPAGRSVLAGTGDAADWLRAHAHRGARIAVTTAVTGEHGPPALAPGLGVFNGGRRLLRHGRPAIDAEREGFDHPDEPGFYYAFGLRRNPRTMAGVTRDGRLLLVAVDGRAPGYSAGLDFDEETAVMRALGADDAVNLDGGGSATMTIRGAVVTRPSDATGERPIGDAILLR